MFKKVSARQYYIESNYRNFVIKASSTYFCFDIRIIRKTTYADLCPSSVHCTLYIINYITQQYFFLSAICFQHTKCKLFAGFIANCSTAR